MEHGATNTKGSAADGRVRDIRDIDHRHTYRYRAGALFDCQECNDGQRAKGAAESKASEFLRVSLALWVVQMPERDWI